MDNEKVKQVKNAVECCSNREIYNCTSCPYRNVSSDCQDNLIYDMGVYINELEKENAIKTDTIADLLNKQEAYEAEKLKQFAERLKIESCNKIHETLKEFLDGKV